MKIVRIILLVFNLSFALTKYDFIQREFSPFKMLAKNNFFRRNQRGNTCEKDDDEEIARIFSEMKLDIPFSFYDSISFK